MESVNIKQALRNGVVTFSYTKKDGSLRVAKGTTKSVILERNGGTPRGGENNVKDAGYTSYFDLEKNAWRCFAESKLVEVISVENEG